MITGAPGSGKTKCLGRLRGASAQASYEFLREFEFLEEAARTLLQRRPDFRDHWEEFHLAVYNHQVKREDSLGDQSFITDRGTADAFAFHPDTAQVVGTTIDAEYGRYDSIVQLGTTAGLSGAHYSLDPIRTEPEKKALDIERELKRVWGSHPQYHFVAACQDFDEKFKTVADIVRNSLCQETD